MEYLKRTWCEINLDHIQYNINALRQAAQKELIAVVKADAYGHGDAYICRTLQEDCGIQFFAVSNINEALNLRHNGITGNILILGYTPPELTDELIASRITQTVHCTQYAETLNREAHLGKVMVHLKADTGMHRIGFPEDGFHSSTEEILSLRQLKNLDITGIFTHFACSDSFAPDDIAYTRQQMEHLDTLVSQLEQQGMVFQAVHAQNSAGITNYENSRYNYARAGISMYGLDPSQDVKENLGLKPVLSFKTVVTMVKEIPAGAQVSYGRTFTAPTPMKLATLAVGYADGYSRSFSNQGEVLIRGQRCPIVGRVCMDQCMVDVTALSQIEIGDTATLIGTDQEQEITAWELADWAGTIHYEILCNISKRVPRVYLKQGNETGFVDYSLE
ncbi:MAG: alanine racemase [Massiliimalia sp.]